MRDDNKEVDWIFRDMVNKSPDYFLLGADREKSELIAELSRDIYNMIIYSPTCEKTAIKRAYETYYNFEWVFELKTIPDMKYYLPYWYATKHFNSITRNKYKREPGMPQLEHFLITFNMSLYLAQNIGLTSKSNKIKLVKEYEKILEVIFNSELIENDKYTIDQKIIMTKDFANTYLEQRKNMPTELLINIMEKYAK